MFYAQILVNILIFIIGIVGIVLNRGNILLILMCGEIVLLSCGLMLITFSGYLCDVVGHVFFLLSLTVTAAESAIGLALLISFFKIRYQISISDITSLRG